MDRMYRAAKFLRASSMIGIDFSTGVAPGFTKKRVRNSCDLKRAVLLFVFMLFMFIALWV